MNQDSVLSTQHSALDPQDSALSPQPSVLSPQNAGRWQELVATALMGTARQPVQLPPAGADALDEVLAALDSTAPEHALLSAAATLALYRRAGQRPTIANTPPPLSCPPDDLPCCSPRAAQQLALLLSGTHRQVLPEWLAAVAAAGQRVPDAHLVALLEQGKQHADLRTAILPVLGQRGAWLAAQNPDWHYVDSKAPLLHIESSAETHDTQQAQLKSDWETGGRAARQALLTHLRSHAPALARDLVAATWSSEKADDRKRFLTLFDTNLSLEDEPFLEAALDDRSKEVRRTAADLLAHLPDSRLTQRMIARVAPLLAWTADKPARLNPLSGRKSHIEVTLPTECDKAMERDGIEPKSPQYRKIGEKAWWLMQMLGAVPPAFWCQTWQTTPDALVEAAARDKEWRNMLLQGWMTAARRHGDADWIAAILLAAIDTITQIDTQHALAQLPPERQEAVILHLFQRHREPLNSRHPALRLLSESQHTWSVPFARAVRDSLHRRVAKNDTKSPVDWQLRNALPTFALRFPVEMADEMNANWPTEARGWSSWSDGIEQMLAILNFRHEMLKELHP